MSNNHWNIVKLIKLMKTTPPEVELYHKNSEFRLSPLENNISPSCTIVVEAPMRVCDLCECKQDLVWPNNMAAFGYYRVLVQIVVGGRRTWFVAHVSTIFCLLASWATSVSVRQTFEECYVLLFRLFCFCAFVCDSWFWFAVCVKVIMDFCFKWRVVLGSVF